MNTNAAMSNVRALIDHNAKHHGDNTFIVDAVTKDEITFLALLPRVQGVAQHIADAGVQPGQSVAYAMANSIECATVLLGILYGGFRATAINLVAGSSTIAYVLEHSESKLILTETAQSELLAQAFEHAKLTIPTINIDAATISSFSSQAFKSAHELQGCSDGLLMYTSGTTGTPKGVILSHGNLIAGGLNTAEAHQLTSKDTALCVLPMYHINGLCVTLMGPLVSIGTVVLPNRFSVNKFWQWINQFGCTWFSVVPTQISYLLHDKNNHNTKNSKLRFGRSASAPLAPEVQKQFEQQFGVPIVETMGLTETAAQILSNPLPPGIRKIGSPGIAFGGEVRIVDKNTADKNQQSLPAGVEGELLVRGNNIMQGYFKNPEATAEALVTDGWLRTGDLATCDSDGYIFVTGRLKELIIKGGENIAPREIDEALYKHPSVIEAAAFPQPCKDYGQRVEAAVSIDAESDLDETTLLAHCRSSLGDFKTPDRIHFLEELPKGPSGKIQRRRLVELFT